MRIDLMQYKNKVWRIYLSIRVLLVVAVDRLSATRTLLRNRGQAYITTPEAAKPFLRQQIARNQTSAAVHFYPLSTAA